MLLVDWNKLNFWADITKGYYWKWAPKGSKVKKMRNSSKIRNLYTKKEGNYT